jgi:ATP-dependent Zn protease
MNSKIKIAIALLTGTLVCAAILIWAFARPRGGQATISYSQFLEQVQAGRVAGVKISAGNSGADAATVRLKDGTTSHTVLPGDYSVALATMQQRMVNVEIQDAANNPIGLALSATPFLILLAIWVYFTTTGRTLLGRR